MIYIYIYIYIYYKHHYITIHLILVLYKFPLVELDTSVVTKPLAAAGIESSETLTLEPRDQMVQLTRGIAPPPKPILALKEIPDDNSCLFNAIGFVLENQSLSKAYELRSSTNRRNS